MSPSVSSVPPPLLTVWLNALISPPTVRSRYQVSPTIGVPASRAGPVTASSGTMAACPEGAIAKVVVKAASSRLTMISVSASVVAMTSTGMMMTAEPVPALTLKVVANGVASGVPMISVAPSALAVNAPAIVSSRLILDANSAAISSSVSIVASTVTLYAGKLSIVTVQTSVAIGVPLSITVVLRSSVVMASASRATTSSTLSATFSTTSLMSTSSTWPTVTE